MRACSDHVWAELASLSEGWDGYDAYPISDAALAVVRALHVVPTCNGGIQIEWHANGWDVEVEVSKDGIPTGVLMERDTPEVASMLREGKG